MLMKLSSNFRRCHRWSHCQWFDATRGESANWRQRCDKGGEFSVLFLGKFPLAMRKSFRKGKHSKRPRGEPKQVGRIAHLYFLHLQIERVLEMGSRVVIKTGLPFTSEREGEQRW